ncbi:MAG: MltA domain-containing protein [Planctomycetota bacterium]
MKRIQGLASAGLCLLLVLGACQTVPDYNQELAPGASALLPLGPGDPLPDFGPQWERRDEILSALENSIAWTRREHARQFFPVEGVTHERALASLERFRDILETSYGPGEFQRAVEAEFEVYKSAGWNGRGGGVLFTAYCTPILRGSPVESSTYRFPLYAKPDDLVKARDGSVLGWETAGGTLPHYPTRATIESRSLLAGKGLELVWLSDPIDAFLAHVNGSAFIELLSGEVLRLGYAAKNGRAYTSLGKELESAGVIERASLRAIRDWAAYEDEGTIFDYLHRNASYVFFTPIDGNPHGSLDVEVTAERSIATDKSLFPRGAITFVEADVPGAYGGPEERFEQFLLDQDTGGAIRTAGRADLYLGIGDEAEDRAGRTKSEGQLYYLFLRD